MPQEEKSLLNNAKFLNRLSRREENSKHIVWEEFIEFSGCIFKPKIINLFYPDLASAYLETTTFTITDHIINMYKQNFGLKTTGPSKVECIPV